MTFTLNHRLRNDTVLLQDLGPFRCLLANDRRFPWLIMVPMVNDVSEIYQLTDSMQQELAKLSASIGEQLMSVFHGDSLNVAAIGNVVSQLHIHHVVRYQVDEAWPGPVWGHGVPQPYEKNELNKQVTNMLACLA